MMMTTKKGVGVGATGRWSVKFQLSTFKIENLAFKLGRGLNNGTTYYWIFVKETGPLRAP